MKKLILALLAFLPLTAFADVTCSTLGQYTYCYDSATGRTTTCYVLGQYTYCN